MTRPTVRGDRTTLTAMAAGLALTLAATIAPYLDRATSHVLADHVRDGYPGYSAERVDSAVTTYLVILTVVGALGALAWVGSLWAVRSGRRWAPWAATAVFVLGTAIALTGLLVEDTSGEPGLAPQLALIGMLPSLAGLVAVVRLWQQRAARPGWER